MKELVIGCTGFIGGALFGMLPGAIGTSSRPGGQHLHLDLRDVREVPACDIAYICAGANGAKRCEGSQDSFLVNVDGPIEVARIVTERGGFVVWISSMSIEWMGAAAYQRQKLAAESVLRLMPGVGVVRAGRVVRDNVQDLCMALIRIGRSRQAGLVRWGNDELAYAR